MNLNINTNKKKLIIVLISIIVIALMLLFKTSYLKITPYYISNSKNLSSELTQRLLNGKRVAIVDRISASDLKIVTDKVYDNPYSYPISQKYHAFDIGNVTFLIFKNKYKEKNISSELETEKNKVISEIIKDDMTEYEKTVAIHDWICQNIEYGTSNDSSDQDIYGALIKKKAVCAGYAECFTYLLNAVGIKSQVISGYAYDSAGNHISHAWNIVYLDNKPAYFDITWDATGSESKYNWFGLPSENFKYSHFPSEGYKWVECNNLDLCYFYRENKYLLSYSAEQITDCINKQGNKFEIMCANKKVYQQLITALKNKKEIMLIMWQANISTVTKITYKEKRNSLYLGVSFE